LRPRRLSAHRLSQEALRARRKFLRYFPGGYADETFHDWERNYKARAAQRWQEELGAHELAGLVRAGKYQVIASRAVAIESRTNLLFSFEKMALRDAVRTPAAARRFALGLVELTNDSVNADGFQRWCEALASLPRRQTRVLSWPIVTVFGFLARPDIHMFLKPNVTRRAAAAYGFDFQYESRPNWRTYQSLLEFAALVRRDTRSLRPHDMIDLQSFIWVQGSDEYP
jgi:hypothetical protein